MDENDIQSIFIDINKAIEACHKCEKFKILPKNKPNFPIYFVPNPMKIFMIVMKNICHALSKTYLVNAWQIF